MVIRTYNELISLDNFDDRFQYLKLNGKVAELTFGFDRYLNQAFYKSSIWLKRRDEIIVRDLGCDLGIKDLEIRGSIYIHHMNPININDIIGNTDYLLNPDYLICSSFTTHNAIHYGTAPPRLIVDRRANDTCPWKR